MTFFSTLKRNKTKLLFCAAFLFISFQFWARVLQMETGRVKEVAEHKADKVLPFKQFSYPLNVNMSDLVKSYKRYKQSHKEFYVKPINVYPYKFLSEVSSKCNVKTPISLLLMVKSATTHFRRRDVIRETWGNETLLKSSAVKTVFVVGNPMNSTIQELIEQEKQKYNDVIQIDYQDSYYNNTIKTVGAIRWIAAHCSNAKFAMIADDDFYVATDLIVRYLTTLPENTSLFMGHVWKDIPQRGKTQKWYMPIRDYPFDKYPPFISAGATIMSMSVVTDFDIAIQFTKKFKFDDVFLAIVAYKLGVVPKHSDKIFISVKTSPKNKNFHSVLAAHQYQNETELRQAWDFHQKYMKSLSNKQVKT